MYSNLLKLLENSYSPYSNFAVAAIVVDNEGNTWNGVNVENAAYPSGLCAERSALFGAISYGWKPGTIKEIHIISRKKDDYLSPCGSCRQVMTELMKYDAKIFQYKSTGEFRINFLYELIPFSILGKDIQ
ncbi:cytidine deaminase [Mycoplasma iguanae]|uniref:Cytidine deaminase n=1 Tax=Mycoplasma iguanae TaxID=292461 RepID=A0ABY5R8W0_9MOLU|nr:cytidine deaminase [Mycoplasma iguanae]UVD81933.1 cytidine deaminase [Mycoplasma iguanae]